MKEVKIQTVVHTIGVAAAVGLYIWSDKLSSPIKGKKAGELSDEMAENVGSVIGGFIKEIFDQPYEIKKMSFDLLWNMGLPCLFLFIALCILGYVSREMIYAFWEEEESGIDRFLKIILTIALLLSTILVLIKFGHLLFLNIVVAFVALFLFGLLILGFGSLFAKEHTT
ncbi:hypothetical protein ACQCVB_17400 [Fictibacillus phosphorivorans]|uniref:hypothetical protein n=1 Tax=Fictibacillus phosphorivorans TaxID=1221500 RepID=UPI003CEAC287